MATPTLAQLLAPPTADQEKATLLGRLSGKLFPVTDWQEGGVARTLVELFALGFADVGMQLVAIAGGGFVLLAATGWLTLLAKQLYNLDRNLATFTLGTCQLAASPAAGYTVVAGQLVAQSASGLRFTNTTGGVLVASGTLNLTFQAESAGSKYNVGIGTITTLLTPLPGVTINNPDNGSGTWITSQGSDDEADASLQGRCTARWPSLGSAPTESVFDLWAKTASAIVTRTRVIADAALPGQVDVYLAGAGGSVGNTAVTAVNAFIQPRVPITNTCVVSDSQNEPILVQATIYARNGFQDSALAAANANLTAYWLTIDVAGLIYLSDVFEAMQSPAGVRNVEIQVLARQSVGAGVGDIDLGALAGTPRVATLVPVLTVVQV